VSWFPRESKLEALDCSSFRVANDQNGNGNISQPAMIERKTKEQKRIKKYLKRSPAPYLEINARTSEVRKLKISNSTK
jgi:hypothetical protein